MPQLGFGYVTFPSTLLHSKQQVAGRQVYRLKKFAVISNMHITIIVERDSPRHLHSLVPRYSSGFEERVGMSLTFAEQSSFLVLM